MFSFLRRNALPRRDLCCLFKYSSVFVKFISTDTTLERSFAISYLINTCGVSKDKAISAPKGFSFESSQKPDLVLALFRDNGFSNTHISKIIGKHPLLLLCSVDKTLKPKFEFFKSRGIAGSDFAEVVCKNPNVLQASLEKKIIPCFDLLRNMVKADAKLLAMLKRSPRVLREDPQKNLLPNVALLKAQGVPADNIVKLLVAYPLVFLIHPSRFCENVEEVKKMKFDPSQSLFLVGLRGLTCMSRSSLEAKFDVYRRWGLSEGEMQSIFRKYPYCLMISKKNIMSTMDFFVNKMGYAPSLIAKQPTVLGYSLRMRIIPRCSVIQMLKAKGLIGDECSLYALLQSSEEIFLKKFVIEFEKEVPELLNTYKGKGIMA